MKHVFSVPQVSHLHKSNTKTLLNSTATLYQNFKKIGQDASETLALVWMFIWGLSVIGSLLLFATTGVRCYDFDTRENGSSSSGFRKSRNGWLLFRRRTLSPNRACFYMFLPATGVTSRWNYITALPYSTATLCQNFKKFGQEVSETSAYEQSANTTILFI